jgi:hypothetical protein
MRAAEEPMRGSEFERMVADAFTKAGFLLLTEAAGRDAGIDVIAHRQVPGSELSLSYVVQCKSSRSRITVREISDFAAKLAPWSIFASLMNRKFVPLSTTSGLVLYLGTGVHTSWDDSFTGTLHLRTADKLKLRDSHVTR